MLAFAVVLTFPIFFYRHIMHHGIGLRAGSFLHDCASSADLRELQSMAVCVIVVRAYVCVVCRVCVRVYWEGSCVLGGLGSWLRIHARCSSLGDRGGGRG